MKRLSRAGAVTSSQAVVERRRGTGTTVALGGAQAVANRPAGHFQEEEEA
jgi:hypothetical protein